MSRELKFKVYKGSELIGIERLGKDGWEWMVYAINPDKGERWTPGSLPASKYYVRCQYTGLKDRNGKEIYEMDIVSGTNGLYAFVVTYIRNSFIAVSTDGRDEFTIHDHWEVIGNIHQDKHLLS